MWEVVHFSLSFVRDGINIACTQFCGHLHVWVETKIFALILGILALLSVFCALISGLWLGLCALLSGLFVFFVDHQFVDRRFVDSWFVHHFPSQEVTRGVIPQFQKSLENRANFPLSPIFCVLVCGCNRRAVWWCAWKREFVCVKVSSCALTVPTLVVACAAYMLACACMYDYVLVFLCLCMCVCVFIYLYVDVWRCAMCLCVCLASRSCVRVCVFLCTCACLCLWLHVSHDVCVYIYLYFNMSFVTRHASVRCAVVCNYVCACLER